MAKTKYRRLQAEAKKLGINSHGKKMDELEKEINEMKAKEADANLEKDEDIDWADAEDVDKEEIQDNEGGLDLDSTDFQDSENPYDRKKKTEISKEERRKRKKEISEVTLRQVIRNMKTVCPSCEYGGEMKENEDGDNVWITFPVGNDDAITQNCRKFQQRKNCALLRKAGITSGISRKPYRG